MILKKKDLNYTAWLHCMSCRQYLNDVGMYALDHFCDRINQGITPEIDFRTFQPPCPWFIEHVVNGELDNSSTCIWFEDDNVPPLPMQ